MWLQNFYRCTIPGCEELRLRTRAEEPPIAHMIQSPYDLDARYGSKHETHWTGYKLQLTETCDAHRPRLITQVVTTPATTHDYVMGLPLQDDLAAHDLLPATHLLDSGYVDSELLATAPSRHQIDVVGPPVGTYSRQHKAGQGYDLHAFHIDWDREQARCPQGHTSAKWSPGHTREHIPVIRIRFPTATYRACPVSTACTSAKTGVRKITVRPRAQHEALAAARQRQTTSDFKAQYALRAGVESSMSQGTRRYAMRRSRYIGLQRTQLQQVLVGVAMNLVRIIAWLWNETLGDERRPLGHFGRLAPRPLSRQAMLC